jgi:hypothetical protein
MCSRVSLCNAETYSDIHSDIFEERTDDMLTANFLESQEISKHLTKTRHVNSIYRQSLYHNFPYFQSTLQLPQCSSHDLLEGCVKLWMKIILFNLVKLKWFPWEFLERAIETFPYSGKDARLIRIP